MKTERQKLIRNAKRCLSDLFGGHVWKYDLAILRQTCDYALAVRRGELASDEVRTLEVFAQEYQRRQLNNRS